MSVFARTTSCLGLAAGAVVLLAGPAMAEPNQQDTAWLKSSHQYNLTEIAAGTAAQSRASSAEVKELGQKFVRDHTAQDATLRATAQELGVELPDAPNAKQRAQLEQASATEGAAFDALFLAQQTAGHREALAAGRAELANGQDADVLTLARASAPVVLNHLDHLLEAQGISSPTGADAGFGGQAAGGDDDALGAGVALLGVTLLVGAGTVVLRRSRSAA